MVFCILLNLLLTLHVQSFTIVSVSIACAMLKEEKETKCMSKTEIKNRIEQLEKIMWFEEMKNFIDWHKYNEWERERAELKAMLEEEEK